MLIHLSVSEEPAPLLCGFGNTTQGTKNDPFERRGPATETLMIAFDMILDQVMIY